MNLLEAFPVELFCRIVEHLVMSTGIYKAVLLRSVNRSFNAAILQAICVSQVVDIEDPAFERLPFDMPASLKGKIYLVKSRSPEAGKVEHLVEFLQASQSPLVADVNGLNPYFGRPLPLAAAWGHLHIVRHLLHHGADPHLIHIEEKGEVDWDWVEPATDGRRYGRFFYTRHTGSALQVAVLRGHEDIVRLLLEPKYRLPPTEPEYLRAIVAGARGGHLHLIQLLFQTIGKDVSHFPGLGDEMLWEAVRHDRTSVVQMLLHSGINVNSYPWPNLPAEMGTLSVAAAQGNVQMVCFLLNQGADVNYSTIGTGNQPIGCAARCGQEEVVKLLLEHGADPIRALQSAAKAGQARVVKLLLSRDADLPKREGGEAGKAALRKAIVAKNPTIISLLVDAGVPLNDGYRAQYQLPIFRAKSGAAQWIVDYLISLGAEDQKLPQFVDLPTFLEEDITRQEVVRGVHVTRRTWEWVGKY